jgi:hypothetical protein
MPITSLRKSRFVRRSDYIFTQVPFSTTTVLNISGASGRINAIKITSSANWTFTLEVDGVVETSTIDYISGDRWITPDLDGTSTAPVSCNISFINSLALRINTPAPVTVTVHTHVELDTEVLE